MTTTISTLEMTQEQWLGARKQSIGASEIGVLMGLSEYKTPLELWQEKVADEIVVTPENDAMHFGKVLEQTVADEYARRNGRKVVRDNKIRIHPRIPQMTCSLDRIILPEGNEGRGVLECKTVSGFAFNKWDDDIPLQYYAQIQQQLAITGYTWGVLALLVDGRSYRDFNVERDEKFIGTIEKLIPEWWEMYVVSKVEPPARAADYEKMTAKEGAIIEATDEAYAYVMQLAKCRGDIKQLEEVENQLVEEVKKAIGDGEVLEHEGAKLASWKNAKDSVSIDSKRLIAELPEVAAIYSVPKKGGRRFLLTVKV